MGMLGYLKGYQAGFGALTPEKSGQIRSCGGL